MALVFLGKLLDVRTGDYNSLVFESERYDFGLQKIVPVSETVGISNECMHFLPNYKKHIGDDILVPVNALKTKKGGIFLLTQGDAVKQDVSNET